MFWTEKEADKTYVVPDDIVDLAFKISCKCLPLEHSNALSKALIQQLPWLEDEQLAGIHLIHGAESGNGWIRPEDTANEILYLSKRTRMTLRLPQERVEQARELTGTNLDIDGYSLNVGEATVKLLSTSSTIFSRYVVSAEDEPEDQFLKHVYTDLKSMGVDVNKILCGKSHALNTEEGPLFTRSVMLAELGQEDSVKVQQLGLGPHRKLGCGLFIPHKGIAPVKQTDE
jgi:CRISPR-associated protein Cas6